MRWPLPEFLRRPAPVVREGISIAWSAQLGDDFLEQVLVDCEFLKVKADDYTSCMAFETNRTFDPGQCNAAGSGAIGLIQFMPSTAHLLGTTTEQLAQMTAVEQLAYVRRYFEPRRGQLNNLGDLYMAILWPDGIGKSDEYILFDRKDAYHPRRYLQNALLDFNQDGLITRGEACYWVRRFKAEGQQGSNMRTYWRKVKT